jgi:hypothetical protein
MSRPSAYRYDASWVSGALGLSGPAHEDGVQPVSRRAEKPAPVKRFNSQSGRALAGRARVSGKRVTPAHLHLVFRRPRRQPALAAIATLTL